MNRGGDIGRLALLGAISMLAPLAGCDHHAATAGDCRAVLDRLVELELKEQGFRDPSLLPRWQEELARRFVDDLARCRSVRVGRDLSACLRTAQHPEEIAHQCVK